LVLLLPFLLLLNYFLHPFSFLLLRTENKQFTEVELSQKISELVTVNHHLLCSIGVGHIQLASVVNISNSFGCAAKLTGAGGGGCAITLINPDTNIEELSKTLKYVVFPHVFFPFFVAFRNSGFDVFESSIGGDGVRIYV
jgi:mevalonate kinase